MIFKFRLMLGAAISLTAFLAPHVESWAESKNGSTLTCGCWCKGSGTSEWKSFVWSGTRSGCQSFNKSNCTNHDKNGVVAGTLSQCDTNVDVVAPLPILPTPENGVKNGPPENAPTNR
jgi:hypothetical protein